MGKSSTSSYKATSEADFPTGLPPYGIWWVGDSKFTLVKSLTAAKGAITSGGTNNYNMSWMSMRQGEKATFTQDVKVYELHGTAWHLIYEMQDGTVRDDHELWKDGKAPTGVQAVTDDDVDAAIQSIILGQS